MPNLTITEARARLSAYVAHESDDDACEFDARLDDLVDAVRNAPQDTGSTYRSRLLPPRDATCTCGHTGLDHHHGDTRCWAQLPREITGPGRAWGPILNCQCPSFTATAQQS